MSTRDVWEWCYGKPFTTNCESVHQDWWRTIVQYYGEPHRHYHTMTHIESMLNLWNRNWNSLQEPCLVALGIFFHDIIYDVKASDNEDKSADLWVDYAKDVGIEEESIAKVREWIIMTKEHSTDAHRTEGIYGSEDLHYLLDMDMSVLGMKPKEYDMYARNIRSEYEHIPVSTYCTGRAKILQSFIQIENIYSTKTFRELYEEEARRNLEREIGALIQGNLL
ncbi:hypothetical protein CAPTEDRAFT_94551 [Capitella teleta]|uniref:HD domain-containing protein n=1 Tax=Capitella teleta TaxID=283909 RepID=R7ULV0_CAPTE|nr:hypothetical protein CAPTEDRAFT_94551 [Capitella teleta]|eukprot:ELU04917.1 hypothetical protein CAPTEDRAFT_94551 [Capitella teleta]